MSPILIAFVSDLMFAARIENTAARLGYQVDFIESIHQLLARARNPDESPVDPPRPGEQTSSPEATLIDLVSAARPVLMIFDLNNADIPWREWLAVLKSSPATRRLPILCFGSHVQVDAINAARSAGADDVVARSRFTNGLGGLIQKWARQPDNPAIQAACSGELSELGRHGLEEFNQGMYFEAHETLEAAWNAEQGVGRELYRAILQIGVAYLQIQRGNYNGAIKMFWRVRQWIEPLPDVCRGVHIGVLRKDAARVYSALLDLGPERIAEFDRSLFKPVVFDKTG